MAEADAIETSLGPLRRAVIDPLTDSRWLTLAEENPTDVFHSPQWLRALARTYDFHVQAVIGEDSEGHPVAGMPYCIVDGLPERRIAAPPFSDYCDPIASDTSEWNLLIEGLLDHDCAITVRCLRNQIPLGDERLVTVNRAKWHGLDLDRGIEELWSGLDGSARRAIRKAQKEGVVTREAVSEDELRSFFDLHLATRKYKYRLLAQPYAFFENLWDEFVATGNGRLMLAIHEGRVLGGVLFLEWRGGMYYKFSASATDAVSLRPNDLIIWESIEAAKAKGLSRLDFGLSDWEQEGLLRYKRKYASEEKTITFLRNNSHQPASEAAAQVREILPQLTDLLTADTVPDLITEKAGEALYRLFA